MPKEMVEAKLQVSEALKSHLTRKQAAYLWGQKSFIRPVFIEEHLGDGGRLVAITPINTRPNYYLIRIDSRWWMDSLRSHVDLPEEDHIAEHIDQICEVIEETVGGRYTEEDDGSEVMNEWPALNDECGVCWCDSMDLIESGNKKGIV